MPDQQTNGIGSSAQFHPHLLRLIRAQACQFYDGKISSHDALSRIDRAFLHPLNGSSSQLNAAHAEFDAAAMRLVGGA
jgi:hypothetical protein